MIVINARNVSEALYLGYQHIRSAGIERTSRAGNMLEMPVPVTTVFRKPCERVLFYPQRDANPFFHLIESLWMLAGRNDVESLATYNKRMATYSDDGKTLNGAYGYRWRAYYGRDQLEQAARRMKRYPNDRRTVVAMWDAERDLHESNLSKDIPCNTHIYFSLRDGLLDMTVCCRSNDMIWGAYGANAVHFSVLLEYMAAKVGAKVGTYYQISNSFHAYLDTLQKLDGLVADYDPYLNITKVRHYDPIPVVTPETLDRFNADLDAFFNPKQGKPLTTTFFANTIIPMENAWLMWKQKDMGAALGHAHQIEALDWQKACCEWLRRRDTFE
jgi:hypothetical protein